MASPDQQSLDDRDLNPPQPIRVSVEKKAKFSHAHNKKHRARIVHTTDWYNSHALPNLRAKAGNKKTNDRRVCGRGWNIHQLQESAYA